MQLSIASDAKSISAANSATPGLLAGLEALGFCVYETGRELRDGADGVVAAVPRPVSGTTGCGQFDGVARDLVEPERTDRAPSVFGSLTAELYSDFFALKTECRVPGSLASDRHFRIEFDLSGQVQGLLALYMFSDWWSRPFFGTDVSKIPDRTQMLLWEVGPGVYGCLVPVVHADCVCQLNSRTGHAGADLILHDSGHNHSEAYALAGAFGRDPFELVRRCVARAMVLTGSPGKLRTAKNYPAMFEGVGWCSWNAMYGKVNETDILARMRNFRDAGFPVSYVLIDDGWSPVKDGQLMGFEADPAKFERGLKPLVDELRSDFGMKHIGVWHTFTGYWGGIHQDSPIYSTRRDSILDTKRGTRVPDPTGNAGFGFWNAWHEYLRAQGIDFVKVDNQGATYHHTSQMIPTAKAARGQQYGLQASTGLNFNGQIINCMCMASENIWHWVSSNVARNSDDFFPDRLEASCEHAIQNVYNSLFLENFAWPDWDMWFSYHPHAEYHAAMRAASGGPVYITDEVDKGDFSVLWPLVCSDGKLLRCDGPALPARDCLFADPARSAKPLKAYNRVGRSGIIVALNASGPEQTVRGSLCPEDVENLAGDVFAVREYFSDECRLLSGSEAWELEIEPFGVRLFSIVPVAAGFAAIGLGNKYISPAAVKLSTVSSVGAHVVVADGGELIAYCEQEVQRVVCQDRDCEFKQEGGWLFAQVVGKGPSDVWISW